MSRQTPTRANGVAMGRLPDYIENYNKSLGDLPAAKAFKALMLNLVKVKAKVRVNGGISSDRTIGASCDVLGEFAIRLWRLNFRLTALDKITSTHVEAAVRHYWACGVSAKHLVSIMTQLHKLDDWLGKPGMVKSKEEYLPEVDPSEFKVSFIAVKSKSWTANGVDLLEKLAMADELDPRFGLMLRMEYFFGLRRIEVLQVKPWQDDEDNGLSLRPGIAKGGKPRIISIHSPYQRDLLYVVQSHIPKGEFLGWIDEPKDGSTLLKRNKNRYNARMRTLGITKRDCGVTGHGLRAEFAENAAILAGMVPATRGGVKGQMSKEDEDLAKMRLSESLGHSRTSITGAYLGKLGKKIQNSRGEYIGLIILGENRVASIFMNPPPIKTSTGVFVKLSKRDAEKVDILVVLSGDQDGLQSELASFSFHEDDAKFIASLETGLEDANKVKAIKETELARRLGRKLLSKVGMTI